LPDFGCGFDKFDLFQRKQAILLFKLVIGYDRNITLGLHDIDCLAAFLVRASDSSKPAEIHRRL